MERRQQQGERETEEIYIDIDYFCELNTNIDTEINEVDVFDAVRCYVSEQ